MIYTPNWIKSDVNKILKKTIHILEMYWSDIICLFPKEIIKVYYIALTISENLGNLIISTDWKKIKDIYLSERSYVILCIPFVYLNNIIKILIVFS